MLTYPHISFFLVTNTAWSPILLVTPGKLLLLHELRETDLHAMSPHRHQDISYGIIWENLLLLAILLPLVFFQILNLVTPKK